MDIRIFIALILFSISSFGAQGSGIFFDAHVSRGMNKGDKLYNFEGVRIGTIEGDSICVLINGKETKAKNTYTPYSSYPVEFQYAVRYSFLAGYERSFNKLLSIRGAVGYQNVLMNAYAATIHNYGQPNQAEEPFVSSKIDRHWISIPVDFKVTLPIRRSGLYVAAGPKASILLSSTYTDSISGFTEDLGSLTPRLNLGIGFRFGVELAIANAGYLFIESGYHKGLLNITPVPSATTQEGEIDALGVGFRMNIPGRR